MHRTVEVALLNCTIRSAAAARREDTSQPFRVPPRDVVYMGRDLLNDVDPYRSQSSCAQVVLNVRVLASVLLPSPLFLELQLFCLLFQL